MNASRSYPYLYILFQRIIRYLQVGFLLHLMGLMGIFLFVFSSCRAIFYLKQGSTVFFVFFAYAAAYGFILPFFSQLDARSRYQNYKLVKDLLHVHGFHPRIIRPFLRSRCQRDAVKVAAADLKLTGQLKTLYRNEGYRWYHIFPDGIFKSPGVLLTRRYWTTTLLARHYRIKHFLWSLSLALPVIHF